MRGSSLYAFKGLAGKVGPIGVHASMLVALLGICMGLLGGFKGTVMVPEGGDVLLAQALEPNSMLAQYPAGAWAGAERGHGRGRGESMLLRPTQPAAESSARGSGEDFALWGVQGSGEGGRQDRDHTC